MGGSVGTIVGDAIGDIEGAGEGAMEGNAVDNVVVGLYNPVASKPVALQNTSRGLFMSKQSFI